MDRRDFSFNILQSSVLDVLSLIKPTEDDREKRLCVINELRAIVHAVESMRGAIVEPFGSFVSNLYTRWGDLDISVEFPSGSAVSTIGKKQKQALLRDLNRALRRNGFHNLKLILNARVPLLVYQSTYRNISCDISICNPLGQIKSKFLSWITKFDERFREMVLLIKEWAKAKAINDPKTGTLNSYSLCLLVIFHFQTCSPAIFPPLRDIYWGNIADDLTGPRLIVEKRIEDICAAAIEKLKSQGFNQVNRSSLSELFVSFFEKFSRIGVLSGQYAICTFTGQWERITNKEKWMKNNHKILIEDPFEQPDNAARAVGMNGLVMISRAFEETHQMLSSRTALSNRSLLIASLVRPRLCSTIGIRAPQGHSSPYAHSFQQPVPLHYANSFQQPVPSPSAVMTPIQDRFTQVLRLESHPSSSTNSVQRRGSVQLPSAFRTPIQDHFTQVQRLESRPSSSNIVQGRGSAQKQGQQHWRRRNI